MEHKLKTWPEYFEAVLSGTKNFEIRIADRKFLEGDTLLLCEYNPDNKQYTGREFLVNVDSVYEDFPWGALVKGWVIMSISPSV